MKKAVQQFMLGTVTNSETQARETLRQIKCAGYNGIELCSFMVHPTPFVVKMLTQAAGMPVGNGGKLDWPRLIREAELEVPALHQYLDAIEKKTDAVIAECKDFNTDTIVITGMYRFDYSVQENVLKLAERLNKAGKILKESGIRLLYHNHNAEFLPVESGKSGYALLQQETNPEYVNFEFDSYWCVDAGCDPLAEMQKLGNRMKLWHINDRGCRKAGFTPIYTMDSMELGTGTMNLTALLMQAKKNNCDAVILESHRNWIDKSPVKSFQLSAQFLNEKV